MQTAPTVGWSNWAGNQSFAGPTVNVATEREVCEAVRQAHRDGKGVRVAGSGHSFTPIVAPRNALLAMTGPRGVVSVDVAQATATLYAHTPLREIGPALWSCGVSLRNQGDTDDQTLAGATATGTKGSGLAFSSISADINSVTLVDGRGDLHELDTDTPEEMRAARIGLGLLGIVTRIGITVDPAYGLREHNSTETVRSAVDGAAEDLRRFRHYSILWCPTASTARTYGLPPTDADCCYVKRLSTIAVSDLDLPTGHSVAGPADRRHGRAYAIYPDWADQQPGGHVELEYMVDIADWQAAFESVRELMKSRFPEQITPVQVRWQAADNDNFLSAQYRRDTVSIALVAEPAPAGVEFLRAVHDVLVGFAARPHWGKLHFFDPPSIREAFPAVDEFLQVRERFDPDGTFLNPYLSDLLMGH